MTMKVLVLNCGSSSVKFQLVETDEASAASGSGPRAREGPRREHRRDRHPALRGGGASRRSRRRRRSSSTRSPWSGSWRCSPGEGSGVIRDRGRDRGGRPPDGARGRALQGLGADRRRRAARDRGVLRHRAPPQPAERQGLPRRARPPAGRPARGRVRHRRSTRRWSRWRSSTRLPYVLYERHAIRRYGFHGTSHRFVSRRVGGAAGPGGRPGAARRSPATSATAARSRRSGAAARWTPRWASRRSRAW